MHEKHISSKLINPAIDLSCLLITYITLSRDFCRAFPIKNASKLYLNQHKSQRCIQNLIVKIISLAVHCKYRYRFRSTFVAYESWKLRERRYNVRRVVTVSPSPLLRYTERHVLCPPHHYAARSTRVRTVALRVYYSQGGGKWGEPPIALSLEARFREGLSLLSFEPWLHACRGE